MIASQFHHLVKTHLLKPQGIYAVTDHLCAEYAMKNHQLYMTVQEHLDALKAVDFKNMSLELEIEGLACFKSY